MSINLVLTKNKINNFSEFNVGEVLVPQGISIGTALEEGIFYLKINNERMVDLGFKTFFQKNTNFYQVNHKFIFPDKKTKVNNTILGQAEGFVTFEGGKGVFVKVGEKKDGFFEVLSLKGEYLVESLHNSVKCSCSEFNIEIKI